MPLYTNFRGFVREAATQQKHEHHRVLAEVEWVKKGRPLPGAVRVQGINHTVTAGVEHGDFYRLSPCHLASSMALISPRHALDLQASNKNS